MKNKKLFKKTLNLVKQKVPFEKVIFDLGRINQLSELMRGADYIVNNNVGRADIDIEQGEIVAITTPAKGMNSPEITTAFGILETLTNPFAVLQAIQTKELLLTVPLKYYKTANIEALLDKTGFRVLDFGKWKFLQNSFVWIHAERRAMPSRYDGKTKKQLQKIERDLFKELDKIYQKCGELVGNVVENPE